MAPKVVWNPDRFKDYRKNRTLELHYQLLGQCNLLRETLKAAAITDTDTERSLGETLPCNSCRGKHCAQEVAVCFSNSFSCESGTLGCTCSAAYSDCCWRILRGLHEIHDVLQGCWISKPEGKLCDTEMLNSKEGLQNILNSLKRNWKMQPECKIFADSLGVI